MAKHGKKRLKQVRGRTGASRRQRVRDNAFSAMREALGMVIREAPKQDAILQRQINDLNRRLPSMFTQPPDPEKKQGT